MSQKQKSFWERRKKFLIGVVGLVIVTAGALFATKGGRDFMASVLNLPTPAPFDGTALPVKQTPDWTKGYGSNDMQFSTIPTADILDLPNYDPAIFDGTYVADLNWGSQKDRINQRITFAVPYMGSYNMNSKEYDGQHLAVDIKIPEGTPIYAIANGVVTKSSFGSGFGNHIVVKHPDAPALDNNDTVTLYSGYAHLSRIDVEVGDVVTRGQQIALSGDTGYSTTPHLHFQVDTDNAPWHPWWPSSGVDSTAEQSTAIANTVNPMLWVQRYLTNAPVTDVVVADNTDGDSHASGGDKPADPTNKGDSTDNPGDQQTTTTPVDNTPKAEGFKIAGDDLVQAGKTATITIAALDSDGNQLDAFQLDSPLKINTTGGSLSADILTASDFTNGEAKITVDSSTADIIEVALANTDESLEITFIEEALPVDGWQIRTPDDFPLNADATITIQAVNLDGVATPNVNFIGDLTLSTSTGEGTFTPATLTKDDFDDTGKATAKLNYPSNEAFKIKAQAGALIGETRRIQPQLFTDVSQSHKNYDAISYLRAHDVINGYSDGSFKPSQTVNRVEALKMILAGLGISTDSSTKLTFNDTDNSAWYSPFVGTALRRQVVNGYPDGSFKPANTVNRAEYLKMLVNAADAESSTPTEKPYSDVATTDWFAPFAAYAAEKNIFPTTGGKLNAGNGMTRAEVAETIYRMIGLRETGANSWNDNLEF